VTVSQQEKLHVRDLTDIRLPILVAGALAIPLQTGESHSDSTAGASQCATGHAKESGLRERTCRPKAVGFPAEHERARWCEECSGNASPTRTSTSRRKRTPMLLALIFFLPFVEQFNFDMGRASHIGGSVIIRFDTNAHLRYLVIHSLFNKLNTRSDTAGQSGEPALL
jgi:hypothetical protein